MINRVVKGSSFKGVMKYILHDKGHATTSERVAFVEMDNLVFNDPERATAEMIHTAVHQKELKRSAGLRATKNNKPVCHYALSWETGETPSLKEQMEAARESLKALGLQDHQAMIVGHTDTDNPHVHIVANLVHPTTGATQQMGNDWLTLSNWAQKYREDRGQEHLCPQRKQNNDRRANGEFVKANNMSRQEYVAWKKAQTKTLWDEFKADRAQVRDERKGQYDALWQQKENRFAARRDEIKQIFKPHWRDLFKAQRDELKEFDNHLVTRMKFALRQSKQGRVKAMFQAVFSDPKQRMELIQHHEKIRADLSQTQKGRIADASREVSKAYKYDLAQLKETHRQQNQAAYDATKVKSDEIWKRQDTRKSGKDFDKSADRREDHENRSVFEQDLSNGSDDARRENREKIRKRKERKRSRPRNRGKGRTLTR